MADGRPDGHKIVKIWGIKRSFQCILATPRDYVINMKTIIKTKLLVTCQVTSVRGLVISSVGIVSQVTPVIARIPA